MESGTGWRGCKGQWKKFGNQAFHQRIEQTQGMIRMWSSCECIPLNRYEGERGACNVHQKFLRFKCSHWPLLKSGNDQSDLSEIPEDKWTIREGRQLTTKKHCKWDDWKTYEVNVVQYKQKPINSVTTINFKSQCQRNWIPKYQILFSRFREQLS